MTNQRRSMTRLQKRERIKTAALAAALVILWLVFAAKALEVWAAHPAEQPVSGMEYMDSIRNERGELTE